MNFSEDPDMGIFYLTINFELDRCTINGDQFNIEQELLETQTGRQTDRHRDTRTHTQILILILSPIMI